MLNQGVWIESEMKICFVRKSWGKGGTQIDKIKQNRFFYGMFYT